MVKVDDGTGAEASIWPRARSVDRSRAEAAQRVAWMYFVGGRDADARRVPTRAERAHGDWARRRLDLRPASWRSGDWNAALHPSAGRAAGARAGILCRGPLLVGARRPGQPAAAGGRPATRAAARSQESFYGLLAREALGMDKRLPQTRPARHEPDRGPAQIPPRDRTGGDRLASSAEELLRHQAKIGKPATTAPGADRRQAGPRRARNSGWPISASRARRSMRADRYPTPNWTPYNGWRVDPALAYATSSRNRTSAPKP
jgi:hypothetical protein